MEKAESVIRARRRSAQLFSTLLLCLSCIRAQPVEHGSFRRSDLVELSKLDSTIHLDIRYATANNFMKRPMYAEARAFLQRPAAEALVRVSRALRKKGFGLVVFDGYRPWSVTKQFWDETPPEKHSFVANPAKGSKHNRGCAVDLSLYDGKTGQEIEMPSPYDDFTEKASPRYEGGTKDERAMRDFLRAAMEHEGFTVDPGEWWHFDYKEWRHYRVLDIPFEKIVRTSFLEVRPIVDSLTSSVVLLLVSGGRDRWYVGEDVIVDLTDIDTIVVDVGRPERPQRGTLYGVLAKLKNEAATRWYEFMTSHIGSRVGFVVDGELLSAPMIKGAAKSPFIPVVESPDKTRADDVVRRILEARRDLR